MRKSLNQIITVALRDLLESESASWSLPCRFVRSHVANIPDDELSIDPIVAIAHGNRETAREDRETLVDTLSIPIGVAAKLRTDSRFDASVNSDLSQVDAIDGVVDEIKDFLMPEEGEVVINVDDLQFSCVGVSVNAEPLRDALRVGKFLVVLSAEFEVER